MARHDTSSGTPISELDFLKAEQIELQAQQIEVQARISKLEASEEAKAAKSAALIFQEQEETLQKFLDGPPPPYSEVNGQRCPDYNTHVHNEAKLRLLFRHHQRLNFLLVKQVEVSSWNKALAWAKENEIFNLRRETEKNREKMIKWTSESMRLFRIMDELVQDVEAASRGGGEY